MLDLGVVMLSHLYYHYVKKQHENLHCRVFILELGELSCGMQKIDYTGMAVLEYYSILTFTV